MELPPLGVKLTCYRLLNLTTLLSFGIIKGILTYMGQSTAPTTLDWISGSLLAAVLYWIGLYEERKSNKWNWFFQVDLAAAIIYGTKRVVGGFAGVLFFFDGVLSLVTLIILAAQMLVFFAAWIVFAGGHFNALGTVSLIFGCTICAITRKNIVAMLTTLAPSLDRLWGWQRTMRFVNDYGPSAPPADEYGWIGMVGTMVGLFWGISFIVLPLVVLPFCLSRL